MKKLLFTSCTVLIALLSGSTAFAQYGQKFSPLNGSVFAERNNPLAETIFVVDTTINHVDFGQKVSTRPFVVVFSFPTIYDNNKAAFTFKPSQITKTNMSKASGIANIQLTANGWELTYDPRYKAGTVDDYVVVHTENGAIVLHLTGEIIGRKKKPI